MNKIIGVARITRKRVGVTRSRVATYNVTVTVLAAGDKRFKHDGNDQRTNDE